MARELKLLFVVWLVAACCADTNSTTFAATTETPAATNVTAPTASNNASTPLPPTDTNITTPAPTNVTDSTASTNASTPLPTADTNITTPVSTNVTEPTAPTNVSTPLPPTDTNITTPVSANVTEPTASNNASTTLPPTDHCTPDPCGSGSTCKRRYGGFVCICSVGDFYNYETRVCDTAKIFPGDLRVPRIDYSHAMSSETSAEFLAAANNITTELSKVFNNTDGYSGSIVLKISPLFGINSFPVRADVEISFKPTATITATEISNEIKEYTENNTNSLLSRATFDAGNLCESFPCDLTTTQCVDYNGLFTCFCREGYIPSIHSTRQCSVCSDGQTGNGNGVCVNCPFGYSGLLCKEPWKLALVVTASILGSLLLITLIALIVVCVTKSSTKNRNANAGNPYMNGSLPTNNSAFAGDIRMIPRATSKWDEPSLHRNPSTRQQTVNPVESRVYEDQDNVAPYGRSGPQSNVNAQGRFQDNPYAENRQQLNPYVSKQGYTNSNYQHDNGKRLY